ncbi:MAG: glucokinase [Chloroflexi bacterium]|nr:glucokinase [Chloroflexota bacterium]MCI0649428.1 glucokinase [Chloroflexota bacterium]MCI0730772.1 glucokinase [Chloroflexota bacterium]
MLLAGDIGGTKTVLALFSAEAGPHHPLAEAKFSSDEYGSLEEIVAHFLEEQATRPERACFGVAGPVRHNRVQVTNLPWIVDAGQLSQALGGVSVHLLNDLAAVASAIPILEPADLETLKPGQAEPGGNIAIIAPGTGLGEAFLFWDGQHYQPIPSEGGHTDFAPASPLELELLAYLQPRLGHISYEWVCSGIGIPNLYAFLRDSGRHPEPEWLRQALAAAEDPTPIIVRAAQENRAAICAATLALFMSILGGEAGNLVLKVLATGGVYLGGGIPPRILPQLRQSAFREVFSRKGRFSPLLEQVPVYVILNPRVALMGAAHHGLVMASQTWRDG